MSHWQVADTAYWLPMHCQLVHHSTICYWGCNPIWQYSSLSRLRSSSQPSISRRLYEELTEQAQRARLRSVGDSTARSEASRRLAGTWSSMDLLYQHFRQSPCADLWLGPLLPKPASAWNRSSLRICFWKISRSW